jgi:serine/threonine-protein kinase
MIARPPAARSILPDLPEAIEAILTRALAKDRDLRFQSMSELREALRDPAAYAASLPAPRLDAEETERTETYDDRIPRTHYGRGLVLTAVAAAAFVLLAKTGYQRPLATAVAAAQALRWPAALRVSPVVAPATTPAPAPIVLR